MTLDVKEYFPSGQLSGHPAGFNETTSQRSVVSRVFLSQALAIPLLVIIYAFRFVRWYHVWYLARCSAGKTPKILLS